MQRTVVEAKHALINLYEQKMYLVCILGSSGDKLLIDFQMITYMLTTAGHAPINYRISEVFSSVLKQDCEGDNLY